MTAELTAPEQPYLNPLLKAVTAGAQREAADLQRFPILRTTIPEIFRIW